MKNFRSDHPDIDFMALVSHQLSTPLAAVRWYAELLRKGKMAKPLDETQTQFVDEILNGAARMGELVEDLSNVSHLERNTFTDSSEPTSFAQIITAAHDQLGADIAAKQLKTKLDLAANLPDITAHASMLHMIAQNLLSNATKYTPEQGTIEVSLQLAASHKQTRPRSGPLKNALLFSVCDTGYGIPRSQQARIFEKFFRADNVRVLGIPGSGLGLYIVKTAVSKLGGRVWFESAEHQGSRFFVLLP